MRFLRVGVTGALGAMLVMPVGGLAAARFNSSAIHQPILSISDQNASSDSGPGPAIGHAFRDVGHSVAGGAKNIGHAVARPVKNFGHSVAAGWHSFKRDLNGGR